MAQFALNPGPTHWDAVKRIFHYLAGSRNLWLSYSKPQRTLTRYTNTDSSTAEDRHAITGYTFFIDGGTIL